ncbi:MAG: benzoyl-CoA reductase/2-hydroxyglutaryl-CoA dehydratase subunit BcrC/BadD/HgdB [Bacteroidia bacterium]|jgi:benzoyl-CoA reductase/2-hydroxyglutaryl-CoA dehydratase subunit BcrC/BadD/HgdB
MMSLTALGQPSLDSVTISRKAQQECIKFYKLTLRQATDIADLNAFIDSVADVSVDALDDQLSDCKNDLEASEAKSKRRKKLFIGAAIVGALEGVYIWIREATNK